MPTRQRKPLVALALASVALSTQAATVARFDFNSPTPDGSTATGTTAPSIGAGTVGTVGGVTFTYSDAGANGGSSDPATSDDSGLQTTGYALQGSAERSAGARFAVSTVGYTDIAVGYDLRHSNTSSRYEAVQYSIDGTNFIDAAVFDGNAGDTWFNGRTVNLSSFAGVAGNPNFAFRVVAAFAPGSGAYAPSNAASGYAATGTWRFDTVTVAGTVAAVPEPETCALLLAGLCIVVSVARRGRDG